MDKSIVAVEESHNISDPQPFAASKSLGSLVQINSIAIDISCAMEDQMDQTPEHEHFSIRGFVAGMRKKDSKMCSPFGSVAHDNDFVDNLPPLSVPRFRWWQCSSCVPNIASEKPTLEMLMADRSHNIAGPSNSCYEVDNTKDSLFSNSMQIGDEIGVPGGSGFGEENDKLNKIINATAEGNKTTTCSNEKGDIMDKEIGNPQAYVTDNNKAGGNSPDRIDEEENASSGSDGALSALPYRRKPKLRSLADILVDEKNSLTDHPKIRSPLSIEVEADLNPQPMSDNPLDTAARSNKSPQKKRKLILDEDRGSLDTAPYPIKRLKGPAPDPEKKISDSESEGNMSVKAQQIKMKKHKAVDFSRKIRQTHVDSREVGHKVNAEAGFGNTDHEMGRTPPYFMSLVSGQEMERVSNLGKCKRPESPLINPRKEILGDFNMHGKVALDLSLSSHNMGDERNSSNSTSLKQYRGIPDLNESFTERTGLIQAKHFSSLSDKRSLSLQKTVDMSASCSIEPTREGKRHLVSISEPQLMQNMESSLEPSGAASDDIPMDIVELLAKNQHERAIGNSRKHFPPENINHSIRGSPSVYIDKHPSNGILNFPTFTNTRNSLNVPSGKTGPAQGILKYSHMKNSQLEDNNNQFRLFSSSFTPAQQKKTQFSTSNSNGADLLWPPRRKNVPFHLNINQNRPVQPNGMNFHPFSDKAYKGKTINDMKGQEKKHKSVGSLDAYSNDTIPAMQLLSLMDRGIVSGSSFKVGSSSFLDKPFSPCNHHPRVNGNENKNDLFLSGSSFSLGSHNKDFPGLINGVCVSGEGLKKSYLQGQKHSEQGNSKVVHLEDPSNLLVRSSRVNPPLDICTLNRNPADFSFPDARNEYTISAKDLRPRKRNALKERPYRPLNVDGRRRHRVRIDASEKRMLKKIA